MKKSILLSLLLVSILFADKSEDQLAKELFSKAFKTKKESKKKKKFYLPLKVNHILQDEILVEINAFNEVSISKESLIYISSLLKEKYRKKFSYDKNRAFFPLSTLNQFGIKSNYNEDDIALEIMIPPMIKEVSLIRLSSQRQRDLNGSILPQDYAGGVNLYLNQQYQKRSSSDAITRENLTASSDFFLNLHDYVFEGRFSYLEGSENPFFRDRFRLVKDDRTHALRYAFGDIFLPTHQRVTKSDAFGLSVEKVFNINGKDYNTNVSRVNSYEFFLKNKSRVEIYINNRYNRTLNLEAGTHNLYDLKLPTGLNQIKLKIIEDNGKIEFIDFNDFFYSEILKKGMIRYGAGLGISSQKSNTSNKIIYNKDEKILSAYLDYGLNNWLTIESGIQQTSTSYQSLALEFIVGTPLGLLNPYAIRTELENKSGYKKGINYQTDLGDLNINLGYEEVDIGYEVFNQINRFPTDSKLYHATVSTLLPYGTTASLSASKYIKSVNTENKYSLFLSKNFLHNLNLQLNYDRLDMRNERDDEELYLTLSYNWGETQINYINYTQDQRQRIEVNHDGTTRYGLSSDFAYEKSAESDQFHIRTVMDDEKFRLDSSYMFNKSGERTNQSMGVQFATGMVFAGDKATITAPITSSFVIVDNDDNLEKPLGIEGYQEADALIYDNYAIALGDYNDRTLVVDEANLDFGIDLKSIDSKFITNYKSGSLMEIKVNNYLSIKGVLYDKLTEKPLAYKAFKVFNTITGNKEMSFTNGEGAFTIGGMEEGHYNVSLVHEAGYEGIAKFSFDVRKRDMKKKIINLHKVYLDMPKKEDIKAYKLLNQQSSNSNGDGQ